MVTFKDLGKYGRLGNCLFQIAATITLAKNNGDSFEFPLWKYQNKFTIPKDRFKENVKYIKTYEEPYYHFKEIPYCAGLNLHGYFQSYRYFSGQEEYLGKVLCPKIMRLTKNKTAVHVRRDDYLKLGKCYEILDIGYYERAMEFIGGDFLIFSDDPVWCRQKFKHTVYHEDEVSDFAMMISCKSHIIANSSYSWWAAWLSRQLGISQRVIAPSHWFGPALKHDTKDLIPRDWEKF